MTFARPNKPHLLNNPPASNVLKINRSLALTLEVNGEGFIEDFGYTSNLLFQLPLIPFVRLMQT